MKIHKVEGRIEAHSGGHRKVMGNGEAATEVKYEYITVSGTDGIRSNLEKVSVPNVVDPVIQPGSVGTFLVVKLLWFKRLFAAKVDGQEYYDPDTLTPGFGGFLKAYLLLAMMVMGFGVLSVILVGIPFLLVTLWVALRVPFWIAALRRSAAREGFQLKAVAVRSI